MMCFYTEKNNEPEYSICYKIAGAPSKDVDQPAHSCILLKVFAVHSVDSQGKDLERPQTYSDDFDQPARMRRMTSLRLTYMQSCRK